MNPNAIIHDDFEQGSPEWHEARRGLLTASEMNLALTPTLKPSNNEKTRSHIFEMLMRLQAAICILNTTSQ